MRLIFGDSTAQVTVNLYASWEDMESDRPRVFVAGQWLTETASAEWLDQVTHLRVAGHADNNGYAPSETVRAMVEGRDGTCRFPGCDKPAVATQADHVQRYDHDDPDQQETSTRNMHCLCQKHHNQKTTGAYDVDLHADGTEVWTSQRDGHRIITEPNGPLGRVTFAQRASNRTRVREERNDYLLRIMELHRVTARKARRIIAEQLSDLRAQEAADKPPF